MMVFLTKYSLPIAAGLLIAVFYLTLPDLRHCTLPSPEEDSRRLSRTDALIMAVITLLYSSVAFYRLGNIASPETFVRIENEPVEIRLTGADTASKLMLYSGVGIGNYTVEYTTDGTDRYELAGFYQTHADVLKWHEVDISYYITGGTVLISATGNVWLGEVVALTEDGRTVRTESETRELCDEQALCPAKQTYMNSAYFDEIYHARTAWEQLNGVYPYEITHPPLGKLIIGAGIALFGMTPFGWRFSGTLFGALMLPLIYVFAKKLYGGRAVPTACTLLTATDFMHFVQTRIATIDTYAVFFILLMYLFMYMFVTESRERDLALSGVFFGLGAASKWTCLYAGAGLALIWAAWVVAQVRARRMDLPRFVKNAAFCVVFFILVPCVIYYLSYIPYGIAEGNSVFSSDYLKAVLDNQSYMFSYHSGVSSTHPYSSRWYQWMLDIRPILYYLEYLPDSSRSSFGAFVNPILCWGGLLAVVTLVFLSLFRRDMRSGFLLTAYLAQLVPWLFVRRITFAYHYFPCTVFLALALGELFGIMRLNLREWRWTVGGFVLLSTAVFVLFYPALSGAPVRAGYRLLSWLPTWPF